MVVLGPLQALAHALRARVGLSASFGAQRVHSATVTRGLGGGSCID